MDFKKQTDTNQQLQAIKNVINYNLQKSNFLNGNNLLDLAEICEEYGHVDTPGFNNIHEISEFSQKVLLKYAYMKGVQDAMSDVYHAYLYPEKYPNDEYPKK